MHLEGWCISHLEGQLLYQFCGKYTFYETIVVHRTPVFSTNKVDCYELKYC